MKAQEASEHRLNVAQSQLKEDLMKAQQASERRSILVQEASENRLILAQEASENHLRLAQNVTKADIKSNMTLEIIGTFFTVFFTTVGACSSSWIIISCIFS